MFRAFIANLFRLTSVNMFDRMDIVENIYEGVVSLSYKKLLGHNPIVLDSVGKI